MGTDVSNRTLQHCGGLAGLVRYRSLRHLKSCGKERERSHRQGTGLQSTLGRGSASAGSQANSDITYSSRTATLWIKIVEIENERSASNMGRAALSYHVS